MIRSAQAETSKACAERKGTKIWGKLSEHFLYRGPFWPRGPCDRKNPIPIENFNPGLRFSIPIEHFSLDRRFQSRCFYLRGTPGVQRRARSKISIPDRSLEVFNPEGRDRIFSIPGPSGRGGGNGRRGGLGLRAAVRGTVSVRNRDTRTVTRVRFELFRSISILDELQGGQVQIFPEPLKYEKNCLATNFLSDSTLFPTPN